MAYELEMLRSLCSSYYSNLVKFRDLYKTKFGTVTVAYLYTTSLRRRSADDKEEEQQSFSYRGSIPRDKLTIKFARSSGPGGQNVNKVNTKVDLRFHVASAEWMSDTMRTKILNMEKNRINKIGELVLSSTKYRSQQKNLDDAVQKLEKIIEDASYVPKETSEEKKAHVRRLVRADNEKRLRQKRFSSNKKRDRRSDC